MQIAGYVRSGTARDIEPIGRTSRNAFEDQAFQEAVEATGRKRLMIGGLHTEICISFATVQALKHGYDVMYVTDAVGGRSQAAHRTGIDRLVHAGGTAALRNFDIRRSARTESSMRARHLSSRVRRLFRIPGTA